MRSLYDLLMLGPNLYELRFAFLDLFGRIMAGGWQGHFPDSQVEVGELSFLRVVQANSAFSNLASRLTVAASSSKLIANQFDRGDNSLGIIFVLNNCRADHYQKQNRPTLHL